MIYEPYSVVVVPFPFTDSAKTKKRPALVISTSAFQRETGHVTLLMITTAKQSQWYGDHSIQNLPATQLPVPSYIRQKAFTLDLRLIEKQIGQLAPADKQALKILFKQCLAV
ncbi:MAG: type II toxin-antitoxin system PemK/MazF family toxin [Gammaproteobacteria bacterium]|nr:type II toxin-antitoxin system PemK/MazF family toxin [Gammaproteobacteria bacterium]